MEMKASLLICDERGTKYSQCHICVAFKSASNIRLADIKTVFMIMKMTQRERKQMSYLICHFLFAINP